MSDSLDDAFLALQREYLAELPERLDQLRRGIADLRAGQPEADATLRILFHQLAGSGGSHGFQEVSDIAREAERWLATGPPAAETARLEQAVERLATVLHRARAQLPSFPAELDQAAGGYRALLILSPGKERDQLGQALRGEGYQVRIGDRRESPESTAPGAWPDLIVIGLGPGEGDPTAIASAWTNRRKLRPRAVVLVETLRGIDRLRAIAAGVDAVFPAERLAEDLPRYARTLARTGAPPSKVLLADADAGRATEVAGWLDQANISVVRCHQAQAVQELLDREVPDLLLLSPRLTDADGFTVATAVRQDPRFHLLPVVFLAPDDLADRIAALRVEADDFLAFPVNQELLLQTVVTRAERGRRLREALQRDRLTGLINHPTLMAELEYAVDHGRRHGGPLAFVVFDLDGFADVNERFGPAVGDQVLLHVANVFRASVRASDVIGRHGGEKFGMILRGGSTEGAAVLAAKLRRVLGEQAVTTAEGVIIPLHVSVGWASFPADGASAPELAHAASRALRKEKLEKQ